MLRRDFISKIIEQMVNALARLLKKDIETESVAYLEDFEELLKTYFQVRSDELGKLLEEDDERDAFLLDEKLKNLLLSAFAKAGLLFLKNNQNSKANICFEIIKRIQNQHANLFEFPSAELNQVQIEIAKLKEGLVSAN